MSIDLGNRKHVISTTLVDIDTGKEITLFKRECSRCHFYEDITFDGVIITLRIEQKYDLGNSDPVLDADVYRNISGNKGKKLRNGKWHHALKIFNEKENKMLYEFSFRNLRLRLVAKMMFSLSPRIDAVIVKQEQEQRQIVVVVGVVSCITLV